MSLKTYAFDTDKYMCYMHDDSKRIVATSIENKEQIIHLLNRYNRLSEIPDDNEIECYEFVLTGNFYEIDLTQLRPIKLNELSGYIFRKG